VVKSGREVRAEEGNTDVPAGFSLIGTAIVAIGREASKQAVKEALWEPQISSQESLILCAVILIVIFCQRFDPHSL
jgi:hypothetical protein